MFASESEFTEKASAADRAATKDSMMTTRVPRVPVNTPNISNNEQRSLTPEMSSKCTSLTQLQHSEE